MVRAVGIIAQIAGIGLVLIYLFDLMITTGSSMPFSWVSFSIADVVLAICVILCGTVLRMLGRKEKC